MKRIVYLLCIFVAINNSPLLANSSIQDPATVLITGSNRGIGLALAEHYAKEGWKVIATCRKPNQAVRLKNIADKHPLVMIEEIDVTDMQTINKVAYKYKDSSIDVLINNAGISGGLTNQVFGNLDYSIFKRVMNEIFESLNEYPRTIYCLTFQSNYNFSDYNLHLIGQETGVNIFSNKK